MIVWNPKGADDALFARLREHFSDEQIVELGYFIAITFGQQRWIKTLGIGHGEVLDLSAAGLAPKAHPVSPTTGPVRAGPSTAAEARR
jgi:hypothetical protein